MDINNFHDDMMRADLVDCTMEELLEMKQQCIDDELFEIARIVQLEIDSRAS
jgi:hypothetical protein